MNLELNQITTLFLAVSLLLAGGLLIRKIPILKRFCIPAPVVGGLLFRDTCDNLQTGWIDQFNIGYYLTKPFHAYFLYNCRVRGKL
ncbi:sodium--glutamate symport carrier gltS [Peribacillus simplex]